MNDTPSSTFADRRIWVRGLYMLFFAIAYGIAELIMGLVALFQFVVVLFTGSVDERVLRFGRNLASYVFQVWQFLTFNEERLPFPFSEWPDETPGDGPWRRTARATGDGTAAEDRAAPAPRESDDEASTDAPADTAGPTDDAPGPDAPGDAAPASERDGPERR